MTHAAVRGAFMMLPHLLCCPRDSNDTIHPNLTLPDPTPLNRDIDKLRRESEELLDKIKHPGNHSNMGDVDGKNTFVSNGELLNSCLIPQTGSCG